jgi:hypothetical protein
MTNIEDGIRVIGVTHKTEPHAAKKTPMNRKNVNYILFKVKRRS